MELGYIKDSDFDSTPGARIVVEWNGFAAEIQRVLCDWKVSSQSSEFPSWNISVAKIKLDKAKFILTRHWTCGISEEKEDKKGTIGIPTAWMDMMNKSNLFPRCYAHIVHKYFGITDFIVIECQNLNILKEPNRVIRELSSNARKTGWHVPVFMKSRDNYYGLLEWSGFRTKFSLGISDFMENPNHMSSFYNLFKSIDHYNDGPVTVSMRLSYTFHESIEYPNKGLGWTIGYCEADDEFYEIDDNGHVMNFFELQTIWSDPLEYKDCCDTSKWDPLDAPDWSVRVKLTDTSDVPLVDSLRKFLSLHLSTQTWTLLWNPQISSMLKYRKEMKASLQGLTEPKVRKVTSKLILKPEESLIPVESLNAILDFLFCDGKLQSPQHSKEGNPITNTAKDEAIFLLYKYFKSGQNLSLIGRLAVCMCIVNKYYGSLGAVNQLWGEFVLEMKYCVENNCVIKGLEPVNSILDYAELLQKLKVLNRCIERKKASDASSPITDTSTYVKNNAEIACKEFTNISELTSDEESIGHLKESEEFIDISELPLGEASGDQSESRDGTSTIGSNQRVKMLIERLLMSDKKAFECVNPGCVLGDFVNWCSSDAYAEEMDEGYNEGCLRHKIKLSDEVFVVFQKCDPMQKKFLDDDAAKVLCWLASMKPSDLMFGFMPMLMHSVVTTLLGHTEILHLPFLKDHLNEIKIKVEEFGRPGAPKCDSSDWIKKIEELIDPLTFVEVRMAEAEYLLKKIRPFDPLHTVDDLELQEFVCKLVQFREAPILRSSTELPSNTKLGRVIHKFFINGFENEPKNISEINHLDQEDEFLRLTGKEYIFRYSDFCQSAPLSYQKYHCAYCPRAFIEASALTCPEDNIYM